MSGTLFSHTPLADGPLHTAADHNNPMASIAAILNGGVGTVNIVPGGLDASVFAPGVNPQTLLADTTVPFVVSGLTITTSGSLSSTTASGVAYVNGKKLTPSSTPHTYTASKDTYVDLKDDGTYAYVEVANSATSGMALTTNSDGSPALRVGFVRTSGSAVTASYQLPLTSAFFGFDAIGNVVYNLSPNPKTVWRYFRAGPQSTGSSGTPVAYNGTGDATFVFRAVAGHVYRFAAHEPLIGYGGSSGGASFHLVAARNAVGGTQLAFMAATVTGISNLGLDGSGDWISDTTGLVTFVWELTTDGAGWSYSLNAGANFSVTDVT